MLPRCYSIVGDSNVRRHMNPSNCQDRPLMSGCQVIPCTKLSILVEAMKSIREESTVCVVACLSNFLTSSEDAGSSISFRVEPVLLEFLSNLNSYSQDHPGRYFLVAPPMYRKTPLWYRDGIAEVLLKFSSVMKGRNDNIHLLPSFSSPELIDDGVHLTPYSGMEFVLHLFRSSESLIESLGSSIEEVASRNQEVTRALEDRVVALEQDHRRLNISHEMKTAEDAELLDYHENIRLESWFVIAGLDRLPDMSTREWQEKVKLDVSGAISVLIKREVPIIVVQNSTGKGKNAINTYNVQLKNVADSKEIRDTFGAFFLGGKDDRPPALKPLSIRNRVTPATSTRITILKVLGQRYLDSNPGAKIKVVSYEPRPLLKLVPPSDASDRRVQTFNFIQAIKLLPTNFSEEERAVIIKSVSPKLSGKVRATFSVISDDMIKKRVWKAPPPTTTTEAEAGGENSGSGGSGSSRSSSSRSSSRSGKRGASPPSGSREKQKK